MSPIAMARMAVLAKASSVAAAAVGGFAAGFLAYVAASLEKPVPRGDAFAAGATLASAIVLVAAALYLEHCCRTPEPPDEGPAALRTARGSGRLPRRTGRHAPVRPGSRADILARTVRYPARTGTRWTMTN